MEAKTAIILAGGFGTRLQELISDLPKPMAPVNNRPFLTYLLDFLESYGITDVVICTGYLAQKISAYYGNSYKNISLRYSHEDSPLGTGGAIKQALGLCSDETVFVLNGDSFFDIDLQKFYKLHLPTDAVVSIALRRVDDSSRYGSIETDKENRITRFTEKTAGAHPGSISAGIYLINTRPFLQHAPAQPAFSIEKDFFEKQLKKLTFKGYLFEGYFIDIGIPSDYKRAQHELRGSED